MARRSSRSSKRRSSSVFGKRGLNHSVSVFVPSTTRLNRKVSSKVFSSRIRNTKRSLNNLFGGSTTTRAVGSFTSKKGKIVNERIGIVTAHTNKAGFNRGRRKLGTFLRTKKKAWKQESIGATIETPKNPSKSFLFT